MLRHRRFLAHLPAINTYQRTFIGLGILLFLAYLQLLVGHIWHGWHDKNARSSLADEFTRVLAALAARNAGEPVETSLDVICNPVDPLTYPNNPLVNAILLARRSGLVLPCHNSELPNFNLSACAEKCIIAANIYNSEKVLPNLLVQLVRVAQLLGPPNILVSIYESGSEDSTPEWLQLLGALLRSISVRFVITAGGNLTRAPGQDRIAFLASVRQAALDQVRAACDGNAAGFCNASRIVFLNDVFFDAAGLVRLLQYNTDDVACGLDFEPILADQSLPEQQLYMEKHLQQVWNAPPYLAASLAAWDPTYRLWRRFYRREDSLLRLLPLSFYDIWVARDVGGGRLYRHPPYTRHNPTSQRLNKGLPISAYCCWNGMVVLQGRPLLSRQVSFRSHSEGECYASECSLLCDDLHSQGPLRVVIDPGVRVTYRSVAAEVMYGINRDGTARGPHAAAAMITTNVSVNTLDTGPVAPVNLPYVPWDRTMLADLEAWRQEQGLPITVECCGLEPGQDKVNFEKGCVRGPVSGLAPKPLLVLNGNSSNMASDDDGNTNTNSGSNTNTNSSSNISGA